MLFDISTLKVSDELKTKKVTNWILGLFQSRFLKKDNVIDVMTIARKHSSTKVIEKCLKYLLYKCEPKFDVLEKIQDMKEKEYISKYIRKLVINNIESDLENLNDNMTKEFLVQSSYVKRQYHKHLTRKISFGIGHSSLTEQDIDKYIEDGTLF